MGMAVVVDGDEGSGSHGRGRGGFVGGGGGHGHGRDGGVCGEGSCECGRKGGCKGSGQGSHKGGGRGVLIFDYLLVSLHFSKTIILNISYL